MSPAVQARFLRVLTSGELLRLGSTRPRRVNVRVVVASRCNLEERVKRLLYREDLLYRLAAGAEISQPCAIGSRISQDCVRCSPHRSRRNSRCPAGP